MATFNEGKMLFQHELKAGLKQVDLGTFEIRQNGELVAYLRVESDEVDPQVTYEHWILGAGFRCPGKANPNVSWEFKYCEGGTPEEDVTTLSLAQLKQCLANATYIRALCTPQD